MRTNLVIEDSLMFEARQARPGATNRAVVEEALRVFLQIERQKKVLPWRGKLKWEGDLEDMRRDAPRYDSLD